MQSPYVLTPSQIKILEMASDGCTDKEICRTLAIAPGTLRTYWDRMRTRCDAHSRSEVIAKMQHGLPPQRLRLVLLEKLPFYIWTYDEKGKVDYCNEWFCKNAFATRKEALKNGVSSMIVSEERESFDRFILAGLKDGKIFEELWHLNGAEGTSVKLHKIRIIPLGDTHKWIGYAREIAGDADHQMTQFLVAILS
jgi:DNA-binding CsgD family transcriptional regulator